MRYRWESGSGNIYLVEKHTRELTLTRETCKILSLIKIIQNPLKIGAFIFALDEDLFPLEDPVNILKEML